MRLQTGKNKANRGFECWPRGQSVWIEKWEWVERSELIEESKSRLFSVVALPKVLALLRDWMVSVVELPELLA